MTVIALRRPAVIVLVLWSAAAPAQEAASAPAEGVLTVPLKLVRVDPEDHDLNRYRLALFAGEATDFPAVQAGKGIVNAKAVVARFRMPNGRAVLAAYDANQPDQLHPEVLRIDLSGQGDFTKAIVVPRTGMVEWLGTPGYRFLSKEATIETGQASIPVGIASMLLRGDRQAEARLSVAWCAHGALDLAPAGQAGQPAAVRLLDGDYNLRLGDPAKPAVEKGRPIFQQGDALQVSFVGDTFKQFATLYLGSPIGLNGKLYEATVGADLKTLSLAPYQGPTAELHIDHPRWTAHLLGDDKVISLLGDRTPMPVPPGRYRLRYFVQYSEDGFKGRRHEFHVVDPGLEDEDERPLKVPEVSIDLKPGQTQQVQVGSPVMAYLAAARQPKGLIFQIVQRDASNRDIHYMAYWGYSGFAQVPELTVEILDAGGTSIDKVAVSTIQSEWMSEWVPPAGLKGQFTAKLRYRNDAFGEMKIVQPQPFELATAADGRIEKFVWRGSDIPGAEKPQEPGGAASKPSAGTPLPKEGVAAEAPPQAATVPSTKPAADARARQWLAMARNYQAAGMKGKAREFLARIIAECPDSDEAKEARLLLGP